VEKILAQRLDGRHADFSQRRLNLGELHPNEGWHQARPEKGLPLFTKKCEQNAPNRGFYSQVILPTCGPGPAVTGQLRFV
jgi:hypothetical protein